MPTPIDIFLDPISIGVLVLYATLMLWEALFPARRLPRVSGWQARAMGSFVLYFFLSSYLPLLWDDSLANYQLFDLSGLGAALGATVGLLVYEGLLYFWHRAMHESDLLFRVFHQLHHSAERVDSFGAFYFSPMDMIGFTFLGSLSLTLLVGLSADAATLFLFATMFLGIFQHCNVRSPQWMGYLIQRPESHSMHHGKCVHYFNFSDLPVFDILFGTFRNPLEREKETGFYTGASSRIVEMLLFRDVSRPCHRADSSDGFAEIKLSPGAGSNRGREAIKN